MFNDDSCELSAEDKVARLNPVAFTKAQLPTNPDICHDLAKILAEEAWVRFLKKNECLAGIDGVVPFGFTWRNGTMRCQSDYGFWIERQVDLGASLESVEAVVLDMAVEAEERDTIERRNK